MQGAMREFEIFGPGEASKVKFVECCESAAALPAMAPRGQVNYTDQTYRVAMNQLLQDVAKKARKYRQTMWQAIADARAAVTAANHGVVIERIGPVPDFENPTADPLCMSGNQGSNIVKTESTAE